MLITHEGMSIRFNEEELRDQGRNTVGVWGIRPDTGDFVVAAALVNNDSRNCSWPVKTGSASARPSKNTASNPAAEKASSP